MIIIKQIWRFFKLFNIVNTIGSVDDLIEKNTIILDLIQKLIALKYNYYAEKIKTEKTLGSLIERTGKLLKNEEWIYNDILDLSTMPSGSIFINTFSHGSNFKTNIKTINNFDIVYGSIRPYFKKAGFALDIDYVAGSVFSFNTKIKDDYLWILSTIFSDKFHDFTNINSQGTKMPIINWNTFCTYNLKYDKEIISQYNQEIEPLFIIAVNKQRQNRVLYKTKEILLKKYFS